MKNKAILMAACIMASAGILGAGAHVTSAASLNLSGSAAGVSSILQGYIATENKAAYVAYAESVAQEEAKAAEEAAAMEENQVETVASEFENIAVAQVDGYVNIRSEATVDSEALGKLYDGSVATVLGTEGDWTYVTSGSVTGYIKSEYLAINNEEVFKENSTRIATVITTTLFVREEPNSEDARILEMVGEGDELKVIDELDGWIEVSLDGYTGYISAEYAECSYDYKVAESKEQEEARLAAEAAAKQAASKRNTGYSYSGNSYTAPSGSTGSSVADYALQFLGNPYVYGGSSLTNGTDCSGFVMSVYAAFGVSLPHSSYSLRSYGYEVPASEMQAGDVVCYSGHVGICIGGGQIVHASTYGVGITISSAYYANIITVRRIL